MTNFRSNKNHILEKRHQNQQTHHPHADTAESYTAIKDKLKVKDR